MDPDLSAVDGIADLSLQFSTGRGDLDYIHEDHSWLDGLLSLDPSQAANLDALPDSAVGQSFQELENNAMEIDNTPTSASRVSQKARFHYPAEIWEERKEEIRQLYIDKNFSLPKVMQIMAGRGLTGTSKMFKSRFTQWGFVKNNRQRDVACMLQLKSEREACGKRTVFTRNGRKVDIDRYLRRARFPVLSTARVDEPTGIQNLPRYLSARSPSPLARRVSTLGSLRFGEALLRHLQHLAAEHYEGWTYWQPPNLDHWSGSAIDTICGGWQLVKSGHAVQGNKLLQLGFQFLPRIFTIHSFYSLIRTLAFFAAFIQDAIMAEFWKFLAAYSDVILHGAHPLHGIIHEIYSLYRNQEVSTTAEHVREIFLKAISLLATCSPNPDPLLLMLLSWPEREWHFGKDGEQIARKLLNNLAGARKVAKETFGPRNTKYLAAMLYQLYAVESLTGGHSEEAFQLATEILRESEDIHGDWKLHIITSCQGVLSRYHRNKWLESGLPASLDPRHELARHFHECYLDFMYAKFRPDLTMEFLEGISVLSKWQDEAGLADEARKSRQCGEAYLEKLASLPEPETADIDSFS